MFALVFIVCYLLWFASIFTATYEKRLAHYGSWFAWACAGLVAFHFGVFEAL